MYLINIVESYHTLHAWDTEGSKMIDEMRLFFISDS